MINLENISFDHCIKCTVCTIYCPVAKVTSLFPGPKQSGPDSERLRIKNPELVDASLKYCTNCKRCEIACPSEVKIADLIQEAKWNYLKKHFNLRNFALSRMDLVGKLLSMMSSIANFFMSLRIVKLALDLFLKIPAKRDFPKADKGSFKKWFEKNAPDQSKFDEKVLYFHGCSVNYFDHSLGADLIKVLNALNVGIEIPDQKCCGVPAIANSNVDRAKNNAIYNIKALTKGMGENKNQKIIQTCSSGSYALKYEYSNFLKLDNSKIYDNIEFITKFVSEKFKEGNIPPMKPVNIRAAYHTPCHLERMGAVMYTIDVLKQIPGLDLVILNSECCGMAGTYGFKTENFKISQEIGKNLINRIDKAVPEIVITDCVTCKWQIENFASYNVLHPITILAMAIDEKKLKKQQNRKNK